MASNRQFYGAHGIGKWDITTKRYVPIGGGSRSRLALEIKGVRPYRGFAGVDSVERPQIDKISALYSRMEEGLEKITKPDSYLSREGALDGPIEQEEAPPAAQAQQSEEPVTSIPVEEEIAAVIPGVEQALQEEIAGGRPGVEQALQEEIEAGIAVENPVTAAPVEEAVQEETVAAMPAEEAPRQAAPPLSPVAPQPPREEAPKNSGDDILFTFEL